MPTIKQIYDSIISDMETNLGVTIPTFGKNFLRAMAMVQAAKLKLIYLTAEFVEKNTLPDTAYSTSRGGNLERWGQIKLNRNPFPATQGIYTIQLTGEVGEVVPAQTQFQSRDSSAAPGQLFILDQSVTFTSTTETANIRALEAGLVSKLEVGDLLIATVPLANVEQEVEVTAEDTPPQEAESIELYRQRTLEAFRTEPQGGAGVDYRLWANEASGVVQSYPYAKTSAPNEIEVFIEASIADSTDGKRTPSTQILTDAANSIETNPNNSLPDAQRGRRPLGVLDVDVKPIIPLDVAITIPSFVGLTPEKENAIKSEIISTIDEVRPYVPSVDISTDGNDVLTVNAIISAITRAVPGSVFGNVTMTVDGSSVSSYEFEGGEIPFVDETLITIT